jgi:serine/threonine-protein kinase RsbW
MSADGSNFADARAREFRFESLLRDQRTDVERIQTVVADALKDRDYGESAIWAIRLAIEEAIVNGFRHGNKGDPTKAVYFACRIGTTEADFEVRDEGPGFDPDTVPDPTEEENIEIPSGRGIMLIKAYMTEVSYFKPGNHLRMVYRKS